MKYVTQRAAKMYVTAVNQNNKIEKMSNGLTVLRRASDIYIQTKYLLFQGFLYIKILFLYINTINTIYYI